MGVARPLLLRGNVRYGPKRRMPVFTLTLGVSLVGAIPEIDEIAV